MIRQRDCIIAPATANGIGAIAVLRLSGENTIAIVNSVFEGKDLEKAESHTLHLGKIVDGAEEVDEVLISLFKSPKSYTLEDVVEISSHGSPYIVNRLLNLFVEKGVRPAKAGEFTQRAFMNGRFDLAQAEAVSDLIASESAAEHHFAIKQMRGGFSDEIKKLREELINFASLIELELDFSEEDVEFADRKNLVELIEKIKTVIDDLASSFKYGKVLKEGIPVAIIGKPNSGKSTLLNHLLKEEKAIVTDIPGTTRDFLEDIFILDGVKFRLIDTAGLRETEDVVEKHGVQRSMEQLKKASIALYLYDASETNGKDLEKDLAGIKELKNEVELIPVGNKSDKGLNQDLEKENQSIFISAKTGENVELILDRLRSYSQDQKTASNTTITNSRHYEKLIKCSESLENVLESLNSELATDLIAQDIRYALHELGEITGEITTDDLLKNIFSKFCIGK